MILGRLLSATPSTDGEHWDLQFRWHSDVWHTDAYGQDPRKWQRSPGARPPNRVPYPWQPARSSWLTDDAIFPGKQTIGLYTGPGQITIAGMPPIAQVSKLTAAPQTPLQATVASGGTIAAGTNYIGLVSVDVDGRKSQCSLLIKAGGTVGSLKYTIPNIIFDSKAVSYEAYMGPTPFDMWRVQTGAPSSSITLGASTLPASGMGRPDICFSKFRIRITSIRHGGIWGTGASAIGANSITLPHSPSLDQWAGRIISLYGSATRVGGTGSFSTLCYAKPANFNVTGNDTAGVMSVLQSTLIGGTPFTFPGDAYVMRARADIASATTIGDPDFVNPFAPNGLGLAGTNYEAGKVVWIFDG